MSKAMAGWFGRTHSKSMSKNMNKQDAQTAEQGNEEKENGSEKEVKCLTKCESLPTNSSSVESDDDESQAEQEAACAAFNEKELGPLVSLKEQLEKDKEDESLRHVGSRTTRTRERTDEESGIEPRGVTESRERRMHGVWGGGGMEQQGKGRGVWGRGGVKEMIWRKVWKDWRWRGCHGACKS